ncbi:MAG: glycosyltransferase family 4 protein, partial [Deltaproteobacteria bacterium]|nr:glycosyltransferase family 4 protein [Deltaproteobacteria bacterium]
EPIWRQILFKNLERIAHHWCDRMIFISQPLIDWALRERIAPKDKTIKIYSGIDLAQFQPVPEEKKIQIKEKWGIGQDEIVIGVVSKLWEGKGHAILIKAFKEIRQEVQNAKLVIVGEGYLQKDLQNLTNSLGLQDHVIFTGFQMDVSEISATFDVAVLPSFFEGMGRVLLEAMALGKPVVASNVGGIPDLVKDGINGLLTTPGDVQGLAYAVKKLLVDKVLAAKLAKEAIKMTTEQFSAQIMADSIKEVYIECLNMKGIISDS